METPKTDLLQLDKQLCFSLYAASRMVTRLYQPLLKRHGLTYPQYIVLMILWQQDGCPVSTLTREARLNTNTLTPLLKRLEQTGMITRQRNPRDERQCLVHLTEKGWSLKEDCACIPQEMLDKSDLTPEKAVELKTRLDELLMHLDKEN